MARTKSGVFSWEDVLAQRYQSNKPPPLPRTRRHTSSASPQPQPLSQLLSHLSAELRVMIWEMALGGKRLHIVQRSGQRLGHIVCAGEISQQQQCPDQKRRSSTRDHSLNYHQNICAICNGAGIPQPIKEGDGMQATNTKRNWLLSLALTCRQIYHESIHLLYTHNTFEFSNPWTLPYFRPTIPIDQWVCIRSIELRWSFPGHWLPTKDPVRTIYVSAGRAQWLETCRTVTRLPALRSLVLVLGCNWFCEPVEKLPGFLEPLRELRVQQSRRGQGAPLMDIEMFALDEDVEMEMEMWDSSSDEEMSSLCSGSTTSLSNCSLSLSPSPSPSPPPVSLSVSSPASKTTGSWELRLQGQSYYMHELESIEMDLRRRGIDCWISSV